MHGTFWPPVQQTYIEGQGGTLDRSIFDRLVQGDQEAIQMDLAVPMIPIGMGVYYLAWKYAVGPLNAEVGIA